MVKQGTIIKLNFNPQVGHEQSGYRPALVISNNVFNEKTNLTIVCPITNTNNEFPLHIALDERSKTSGTILCEHLKALDLEKRKYEEVEQVPDDILKKVVDIVFAEIEMI